QRARPVAAVRRARARGGRSGDGPLRLGAAEVTMAATALLPFAILPFGPQDQGVTHTEETFRFLAAPPVWVVALVVVPAAVALAAWSYGGLKRLEQRPRIALSVLRGLALLFCCGLAFQPAFERTVYHKTQSQVHVLIDDSASMLRRDGYP